MLNSIRKDNHTENFEICYIGLGSNLDSPINQIQQAIYTLSNSTQIKLFKKSSLYKSPPMGSQDQNDYINAVVAIKTCLSPIVLLDKLQSIELTQGRIRKEERWSARTLDLDLLLYGNQIIESDRLTVPHYGLTERVFVLYPLSEIAPHLTLPKGANLVSIITKLKQKKPIIEKLSTSFDNIKNTGINFQ